MLVVTESTIFAFIDEIIYIWLKRSDCEYKQAILGLRRAISSKLNMSSPTMSEELCAPNTNTVGDTHACTPHTDTVGDTYENRYTCI